MNELLIELLFHTKLAAEFKDPVTELVLRALTESVKVRVCVNLKIARSINKYVLWLEISVDNLEVVEVFEGKYDLRRVEFGVGLATTK